VGNGARHGKKKSTDLWVKSRGVGNPHQKKKKKKKKKKGIKAQKKPGTVKKETKAGRSGKGGCVLWL